MAPPSVCERRQEPPTVGGKVRSGGCSGGTHVRLGGWQVLRCSLAFAGAPYGVFHRSWGVSLRLANGGSPLLGGGGGGLKWSWVVV
jgi:hypothetical protein